MPPMLWEALGTDVKPEWHMYSGMEPGVVEENWTSVCLTCGGDPQLSSETDTNMVIMSVWLHSNTN